MIIYSNYWDSYFYEFLYFILMDNNDSYNAGESTIDEVIRPIDKYGFYHTVEFKHHNYSMMERFLKELNANYPNITRLYSIGSSVQGRELYVMEIMKNPGKHSSEKPEVKYVGNMHGNEVVGREVLLLLLRYLCENYGTDERVTRLVETVRLHVLPSMNPDGYEISKEGDVYGIKGRANAKDVDLNRNFPDHYEINDVRSLRFNESCIHTQCIRLTLDYVLTIDLCIFESGLTLMYLL